MTLAASSTSAPLAMPKSKTVPTVTCLLDGGWTVVSGAAIRVCARSRRKMKVDSQQVVGVRLSNLSSTFTLLVPSGDEHEFDVDGTYKGRITNLVPPASASGED